MNEQAQQEQQESLRLFMALVPPHSIRTNMRSFQEEVKEQLGGVKWVASRKLHITLKFLGDVPENKLSRVRDIARDVTEDFQPMEVVFQSFGSFPERGTPSVFWAGCSESEALKSLHEQFNERLTEVGVEKETRSFHPHVTLGRVKDRSSLGPWKNVLQKEEDRNFGKHRFREVHLIQSTLTPEGAQYSTVDRFPFQSTGE